MYFTFKSAVNATLKARRQEALAIGLETNKAKCLRDLGFDPDIVAEAVMEKRQRGDAGCAHSWWIIGRKEVCEGCGEQRKYLPPRYPAPSELRRIEMAAVFIGYIIHGFNNR